MNRPHELVEELLRDHGRGCGPVYNSLDNPAPGGGYCRQARWAVPSTVIESREAPLLAERAQPTSYPKRRPAFLRTGMVQVSDTLQESGLF
jgi:hypothetical protein